MQNGALRWMTAVAVGLLALGNLHADETTQTGWEAAGVRAGFNATDNDEDFEQFEAFVSYNLPWRREWSSGWELATRAEASAGVLDGGPDTGFIATLGPVLALTPPWRHVTIEGGSSPTFISRESYGREDLGHHLQFTSHIGVTFKVARRVGIGYRYQHMSNASLSETNPGLDLHMFSLSYRF